jgi:hypothetical protein
MITLLIIRVNIHKYYTVRFSFVRISEQTATFALRNINVLVLCN